MGILHRTLYFQAVKSQDFWISGFLFCLLWNQATTKQKSCTFSQVICTREDISSCSLIILLFGKCYTYHWETPFWISMTLIFNICQWFYFSFWLFSCFWGDREYTCVVFLLLHLKSKNPRPSPSTSCFALFCFWFS